LLQPIQTATKTHNLPGKLPAVSEQADAHNLIKLTLDKSVQYIKMGQTFT